MNFTIVKQARRSAGKLPHSMAKLSTLLDRIGVPRTRMSTLAGARGQFTNRLAHDESFLWDKYEEARRVYRQRIARLHPDRGGCHHQCAELNAVWFYTKRRFAERGIGV